LREKKIDLAVNMRTLESLSGAWKMWLLLGIISAKKKSGRDTQGRGSFFDIRVFFFCLRGKICLNSYFSCHFILKWFIFS
jgi:hypothetical protein